VERHWRSAARRYDAIDQELGGRHVAVLRGGRQHCLKHRFDALCRSREQLRDALLIGAVLLAEEGDEVAFLEQRAVTT